MTVSPGDPIIVTLVDGRRLEGRIVTADSQALVVVDVNRIKPGERRRELIESVRRDPARFVVSASVEQDGRRIEVVERLERESIRTVARPQPCRFQPGVLGWFLAFSGPCPNCDAAQTLRGSTVFPSPLGADEAGELLYATSTLRATDLPADLTWARLREWLAQKPGVVLSPSVTSK